MMIDYVTLLLINMTAGYFLLGCFVWWGLDSEGKINPSTSLGVVSSSALSSLPKGLSNHWAPAFAICGLVGTVCGFVMTFTWPLPKPYSMVFGEMSVLLGVLFLGAALALARGWKLMPLTLYGLVAGATAIVLGVGIFKLGLTAAPKLTGIGFVLSGLAGVFSPIVVWQSRNKNIRVVASLVLFATSGIWALIGYGGYWMHLAAK